MRAASADGIAFTEMHLSKRASRGLSNPMTLRLRPFLARILALLASVLLAPAPAVSDAKTTGQPAALDAFQAKQCIYAFGLVDGDAEMLVAGEAAAKNLYQCAQGRTVEACSDAMVDAGIALATGAVGKAAFWVGGKFYRVVRKGNGVTHVELDLGDVPGVGANRVARS